MDRDETTRNRRQRRTARPGKPARPAGTATPAPSPPAPEPPAPGATAPGSSEPESRSRGVSYPSLAGALALGVMVAVSYVPVLWAGFVWDDSNITQGEVIQRWSGLWNIWFSPSDIDNEAHYWPVVYTTFWLEHKLWGLTAAGYHIVNVLLHLANCLLIWRLLSRLAVPGAWAVAAVFAVHPLHVESVAWIIERKDLLSTLFYLTAALTWMRFTEAPEWRRYCLVLALFTAALLSKSIVVTLPVALLLWHWWQRDRVTSTDLLRLAPLFALALLITLGDLWYSFSIESVSLGYSPVERLLIACRALWFYVGKLLWPAGLAVVYPHWDVRVDDPVGWACVAAAAVLPALLWLGRNRWGRGPLVGAIFFAVTLSPVLGFVDYGYMQFSFVADRYQYLAGVGVMAVLVAAAATGVERLAVPARVAACGLFGAILAVLAALTWVHAGVFQNDLTLFSHIVARNPEARDAHLNLTKGLLEEERYEEAVAPARIAIKQRPNNAGGYANLGLALLSLERFDEAGEVLRQGLEVDPHDRVTGQNMAAWLIRRGRYAEAAETYRAVLKAWPRHAAAHAGLGEALFHLGRYEEAVPVLRHALALRPLTPVASTAHVMLGHSFEKLNQPEEAEAHYRRAVAGDDQDIRSMNRLAQLLNLQGRFEEADRWLRRIRRLQADDATTHHYAAELLRKRNRPEEALAGYREALERDPQYAQAHAGLGAALFALKRYEESLASFDRSIALDPHMAGGIMRYVLAGRAAQALGRTKAAEEHLTRARAIDPRHVEALDYLALLLFSEKRFEEAHSIYIEMLDLRPDNARLQANLAATLYLLGQPREALRRYERALALEPDLQSAQVGLETLRKALAAQAQDRAHGRPEE